MRLAIALLAAAGAAAMAPASGKPVLTVDGLGPVRIGMTIKQAEKALGGKLVGEAIESDDICVEKESKAGPRGVYYMFEDKTLARISLGSGSPDRTPRGIGVGATAQQVRRAYGVKLKAEPHHYAGLPAEYLTFWTVLGKRGIRFETDFRRKVATIHAGTAAIQFVEGCA
ncbi:MAG: hypothetical protein H0W71_04325 [Sphingomonas sp.]|nr:hypothetical protein [Sphingomonas sp.]